MSDNNDGIFSCKGVCWIIGSLLGIAVFLMLTGRTGFLVALVLAVIVLVAVALLLRRFFCGEGAEAAPLTGQAPSATTAAAAAKPVETASEAEAKPAAKPATKKPAAKTTAPAKAAPAKPARKPVAKDGAPETLKAPRAGGADDLKKIKGVGPGLEKTLNEMGFYHFDQVAGWRKAEIEWVDERLKFKGRIERDEWVKQAKALAKGAK